MKENDLNILIDKYFKGETNLEEEKNLRKFLQSIDSDNQRVDELKAVFAYVDMEASIRMKQDDKISSENDSLRSLKRGNSKLMKYRRGVNRWMSSGSRVAAAIAIIVMTLSLVLVLRDDGATEYHTMIACQIDTSHDAAFNLITSQLEAIGEASEEVDEEIMRDFLIMEHSLMENQ